MTASASPGFVVTTDRVRLAVQDWGSGRPVVLLSAWATDASAFQYNVLDLCDRGFRCVAFDRRGHGRSDVPSSGYELGRLADDVRDVLDGLDIEDAVLVGWSLGGTEAVEYLKRHGTRRVSRLVLLAPGTPCLRKREGNPNGIESALIDALHARWAEDFPRWCDDQAAAFFRPAELGVSDGIVTWMKRMLVATPLPVALRCGRVLTHADLRQAMRKLDLATLVLHGDRDASIPVHFGRESASLLPRAKYVELPGAPHGFVYTHRARVLEEMMTWLAS